MISLRTGKPRVVRHRIHIAAICVTPRCFRNVMSFTPSSRTTISGPRLRRIGGRRERRRPPRSRPASLRSRRRTSDWCIAPEDVQENCRGTSCGSPADSTRVSAADVVPAVRLSPNMRNRVRVIRGGAGVGAGGCGGVGIGGTGGAGSTAEGSVCGGSEATGGVGLVGIPVSPPCCRRSRSPSATP